MGREREREKKIEGRGMTEGKEWSRGGRRERSGGRLWFETAAYIAQIYARAKLKEQVHSTSHLQFGFVF